MKKFLFWTAVIVGILAAVAVVMKRRSGGDEDSWQGYLEDSKGSVNQAVDDAMSGPDAADKRRMRSTPPMRAPRTWSISRRTRRRTWPRRPSAPLPSGDLAA